MGSGYAKRKSPRRSSSPRGRKLTENGNQNDRSVEFMTNAHDSIYNQALDRSSYKMYKNSPIR